MTHTAGPWRASDGALIRVFPVGSKFPVCGVHRRGKYTGTMVLGQTLANARLIAAAPEMLEALLHAEAILCCAPQTSTNKKGAGPSTTTRLALGKARAAIAKARGEPS